MVELYKRIETESDLPAPGTVREGLSLDAKSKPYFDGFELGKDMAAFANAIGGVVLVGANEANKLIEYVPLPRAIADKQSQAFEDALRDRCSPTPLVKIFVLPQGAGYVAAINVDAFPGQPVGVSADGGKNKQGVGFAFPMRIASQTTWLLPEQLAMLMLPELRQRAIQLASIPLTNRKMISLIGSSGPRFLAELEGIDYQAGAAIFSLQQAGKDAATGSVHLPLAAIEYVWRGAGSYRVSLAGSLTHANVSGWEYVPSSELAKTADLRRKLTGQA
jgi:hypothetical protein